MLKVDEGSKAVAHLPKSALSECPQLLATDQVVYLRLHKRMEPIKCEVMELRVDRVGNLSYDLYLFLDPEENERTTIDNVSARHIYTRLLP
jgi:hypothetical protein